MPEIWTTPDGVNTTIFSSEDRLELIRARAGPDAERWARDLSTRDAYEAYRASSDLDTYEAALESSTRALQDVVADLGIICNQIVSPRGPTKAAISQQLMELRNQINQNL